MRSRRKCVRTFVSHTFSAPGHKWFRLALCHTLHHSRMAKHDGGVLRWCNNHNWVQGIIRAFNSDRRISFIVIL